MICAVLTSAAEGMSICLVLRWLRSHRLITIFGIALPDIVCLCCTDICEGQVSRGVGDERAHTHVRLLAQLLSFGCQAAR